VEDERESENEDETSSATLRLLFAQPAAAASGTREHICKKLSLIKMDIIHKGWRHVILRALEEMKRASA
jgi:hypothetical protein